MGGTGNGSEPETGTGRDKRGWDLEKPPVIKHDSWITMEGGENVDKHERGKEIQLGREELKQRRTEGRGKDMGVGVMVTWLDQLTVSVVSIIQVEH